MLELKREQADELLGRQQWWSVGGEGEALVTFDPKICSIHITDATGCDRTSDIGKKINKECQKDYKITATIDSHFIEVPKNEVMDVLEIINGCFD